MHKWIIGLLMLLALPVMYATADDKKGDIEKGEYEYVSREQLSRYIKIERENYTNYDNKTEFHKYINKKVKVVDELAIFYDQKDEDGKPEGDKDNQPHLKKKRPKNRLYKFDTVYFRCVIPPKQKKAVAYLRALNKEETERKLVFIYAEVSDDPIYHEEEAQKEESEKSEEDKDKKSAVIFLNVHKLERPADRYFRELEDDDYMDDK
ncbi:MAG: hypothetical protein E3J72_11000 [Planctomycetota bacterium]|nr:MAG: hypothetical protein E3J72_11000 [Planctomycetota bacterium]